MSRYPRSDADIDRYDDRRTTRAGGRYDDRYREEAVDFRRGSGPVPERSSVTIVKERDREESRTPAFLRDNYGRAGNSGTMVLRAREREDIEYRSRRRTPSPEGKKEKESILIRRDRSEPRSGQARRREESREREEITIRREERDVPSSRRARKYADDEREEITIRREERAAPVKRSVRTPGRYEDQETEEIVIRREERDRRPSRAPSRPISHERARSRARSDGSYSDDEIIIRRGEREGKDGRRKETEEILIRRTEQSRSPSPVASVPSVRLEPEPAPRQVIYAPQIHQEVITHHRHVDHGYEVQLAPRAVSRPPSPPSPPPLAASRPRARSEERIEIRRSDTRNGRRTEEDIVIDRREGDDDARGMVRNGFRERDEIDILRTRYDDDYQQSPGGIGPRYAKQRDPRDNLWTEVTKDLVVKEAIEQMGYEYEENEEYYYIFKYMKYEEMARLVGLSEDIRKDRQQRINEIRWENMARPRPSVEPPPPRLAIEGPPVWKGGRDNYDKDEERYIEREIIYRGGRPPPPPGWRR